MTGGSGCGGSSPRISFVRAWPLRYCLGLLLLAFWSTRCDIAQAADSLQVGYWYGDGYEPALKSLTQFITHYGADGSFSVEFRIYRNCELIFDQHEAGTWSLASDRLLRIDTALVNGMPIPHSDDYAIEELTAEHSRYVGKATGVEYRVKRVDAQFHFPECGAISMRRPQPVG